MACYLKWLQIDFGNTSAIELEDENEKHISKNNENRNKRLFIWIIVAIALTQNETDNPAKWDPPRVIIEWVHIIRVMGS